MECDGLYPSHQSVVNVVPKRCPDAVAAQRPFVTRNAELLALLAPQFEEELKRQNTDKDLADRVRLAIQQRLTGRRPTVEDVPMLYISALVAYNGACRMKAPVFSGVLEEARRQLARQYLNNSALELNEAAYLLGYKDGNCFVRAFRCWEGIPPARWREQRRARAAS
jgi:AraC-like DNA-binding protein